MNKKEKRNLAIGVGVGVLVIGAGTAIYFSTQNDDKKETVNEENQDTVIAKLFGYTNNGVVSLYDTKTNTKLSTFDLKSLATGKEIEIEEVTVTKTEKTSEPVVVTNEFEGFIRVPHIVVKGENSWKIQESLTPNREVGKMLQLVKKASNNRELSLIYPGETIYYLQEKDGSSPEEAVKAVQTGKALSETKKVVKKVDENAVYLYSESEDLKTLYAYSDIEQAFYRVSADGDKVTGTTLYTDDSLKGVKDFKVIDEKLYILTNEGKKLIEVDLSSDNLKKEFDLDGSANLFTVQKDFFYYTYNDQLGKLDLEENEKSNILLGDNSTDYAFTDNKLYVLNDFGSDLDNSVLMEVDLSKMLVNNLVELKSNQNAILTESVDDNVIYVAQVKTTKNLNKKEVNEDVVLPIKTKKLGKQDLIKDIPFNKDGIQLEDYVYELNEGKVEVYSAINGNLVKEIDVEKSKNIMPLK